MSRVSLTVAVARLFLVLACVASLCSAFVVPTTRIGGSSFAQRQAVVAMPERQARSGAGSLSMMGGKVAKFGIFSPAVIVAKIVLGEAKLNKVRGKAIALHSQAITEFSYFVGAQGKMRNRLIKKAKTNGDELGFLW